MANKKSTRKSTKKVDGCAAPWAKHTIVGIVIAAVVCLILGFATAFCVLQNRVITKEQATYLEVFDDLAANFARNLDIKDGQDERVEMTGYGVSEEDGAFYIAFDYVTIDGEGNATSDVQHGKVYFWADKERGGYSYAFSYDN